MATKKSNPRGAGELAEPVYKEGEATERIHVWLYAADLAWISANVSAIKKSQFIRLSLRRQIKGMQEIAARRSAASVKLPDGEG